MLKMKWKNDECKSKREIGAKTILKQNNGRENVSQDRSQQLQVEGEDALIKNYYNFSRQ